MSASVPMTRDGYNKIRAEIDRLESVEMPKIAEKIAQARAEGDLKENAEYHAQRENQGLVQAKINELKDKLARAAIIDPTQLPKDEVVFGCTVTVKIWNTATKRSLRWWASATRITRKARSCAPARLVKGCWARRSATSRRSRCLTVRHGSKSSASTGKMAKQRPGKNKSKSKPQADGAHESADQVEGATYTVSAAHGAEAQAPKRASHSRMSVGSRR